MSERLADFYRGRAVLVTGDTGFKGSWLGLWLTRLGARVTGYALPPADAAGNFARTRLDALIAHHDGDVRDTAGLRAVFDAARPSVIFHLAAQSLVLEGHARPSETFDVNVQGTVAVLEAARHTAGVEAVVVVTSDKVYDNGGDPRAHREGDLLGGDDPYSASKACAELVSAAYRASFGMPIATARAGNVIGAGDTCAHRIVPDCVRALRAGAPIALRNPEAVRPWQHVLDPLAGYLELATRLARDPVAYGDAYNFGPAARDADRTVSDLVGAVIAAWGAGELVTVAPAAGLPTEARTLAIDAARARARLGWSSRLGFDEAVHWTVTGYRAESGDPEAVRAHRFAQIARYVEALP